MSSKVISLDFDGVIHRYSKGWGDGTIYDPPTPGTAEAMKKLMGAGYALVIHTTRIDHDEIKRWLVKYDLPDIQVSNIKPIARIYIDDRGWRFDGNWETVLKLLI